MNRGTPMLSLILPIYNEYDNLNKNFDMIYREAGKLGKFEIILAEDGSSDGSLEFIKSRSGMKGVRVLTSPTRLGRGGAIKNAVRIAKGEVIGYMDIDLAVPIKYLPRAVRLIEGGEKFVTGSRYIKDSRIDRKFDRLFQSVSYNAILKLAFNSGVNDHQCGFKFWSSGFIKKMIPEIRDRHWFFDTELIIKSERKGIRVHELPVEWKEQSSTKVRLSDIFYFLKSIIMLKTGAS